MSFLKTAFHKSNPAHAVRGIYPSGKRVKIFYQTKAEKIAKKTERAKKKMELIARCKGDAQK